MVVSALSHVCGLYLRFFDINLLCVSGNSLSLLLYQHIRLTNLECVTRLLFSVILEVGTGILAACLATMKPVLLWIVHIMARPTSSIWSQLVQWTASSGKKVQNEQSSGVRDLEKVSRKQNRIAGMTGRYANITKLIKKYRNRRS